MLRYISIFLLLTAIGYLYDKYKIKLQKQDHQEDITLVRKYLLNDKALQETKPIIWVHIERTVNSRIWLDFGSRNTTNNNQPYKLLCLRSIINSANNDFNVCFIDDDSFEKLIPNWNIQVSDLADPIRRHTRKLAIIKLLYYYGGILVPSSYLAIKPMKLLYNNGINNNDCFVVESKNKNVTSLHLNTFPSLDFIGCKKHSKTIKLVMNYIEQVVSTTFTDDVKFEGNIERMIYTFVKDNKMDIINGKLVGTIDQHNKPILIEDLLSTKYIDFNEHIYGIWIPENDLLKRTKYSWFTYLSIDEISKSDFILSKCFAMSM